MKSNHWQHIVALIQTERDESIVSAAIDELSPLIKRVARSVCSNQFSKQVRDDFVEDSTAAIVAVRLLDDGRHSDPRIFAYKSTEASFVTWLNMTLRNYLKERIRYSLRQKRDVRRSSSISSELVNEIAESVKAPQRPDANVVFDFDSAVDEISSWDPRDRVLFLTVSSLWRNVPEPIWDRWCRESDLPVPFPKDLNLELERFEWIRLITTLSTSSNKSLQMRLTRLFDRLNANPPPFLEKMRSDHVK